ncbi:crotonase/enoyl-CoA hydratase family protein [Microvirga sp. SRT01]|uniref:Crotonase/enoyl-CoA hydratase family protein n=1 Tax=Sphingomonas longa TaxID=2778730 RepID=A0ABS2DA37_9SPHN|nr:MULTISPECIES: crotonase/enoyl-CoA hydratase family protein [Alphaproteobacteria]MBM6577808.1 crotonase/enoyl-CoA hydratase family protein [Sphingomonas sp. BT552]MBR7710850.1 crotonase/enoyl-CoA hydratase family protein [Microvirga sp. SRT01]
MAILLSRRDGHVLTLTLNQPDRRNPISDPDMIEAVIAALLEADRDVSVRAVVLTGAGSAFSSGGDVKKMVPGGGLRDALPAQTRRNYRNGIQRLPLVFQDLEVPVIAAINGAAIGAGCDLACMCDVRIAADSAKFAESFVKMGIVPGDGGAWLLQRIVGVSKATHMALTGEMIDAHEALACGLVSKVVPADALQEAAAAVARQIADNPPHAVRMTKRLMRQAQQASLSAVLEMSAAMQALAHETRDHEEAVLAFGERRPPVFEGR